MSRNTPPQCRSKRCIITGLSFSHCCCCCCFVDSSRSHVSISRLQLSRNDSESRWLHTWRSKKHHTQQFGTPPDDLTKIDPQQFGHLIADAAASDHNAQFQLLASKYPCVRRRSSLCLLLLTCVSFVFRNFSVVSNDTRALLLTSFAKLGTRVVQRIAKYNTVLLS